MNSHVTSYMALRAEARVDELSMEGCLNRGLGRAACAHKPPFLRRLTNWRKAR